MLRSSKKPRIRGHAFAEDTLGDCFPQHKPVNVTHCSVDLNLARGELGCAPRKMATAHLMKSFGNFRNPVDEIVKAYCRSAPLQQAAKTGCTWPDGFGCALRDPLRLPKSCRLRPLHYNVRWGPGGLVRIRVRTFAPGERMAEHPVCGSGNGSVAAYIAHYKH